MASRFFVRILTLGLLTSAANAGLAQADSGAPPAPRAKNAPLVRPVTWICKEQACEGYPVFAYDYLPAVSDDGRFVAVVEERDGWRHTQNPGVRIVAADSGAPIAFFPVVTGPADMTTMEVALRRKGEFAALVTAANDGLAPYGFRPLFPATSTSSDAPCDPAAPASAPACVRHHVTDLTIVLTSKNTSDPRYGGIAKVGVWHGGREVATASTKDWDPRSSCSRRGFELVGARPDARVAVFVAQITATGHNCDGVPESQPWPVTVVRW